MDPNANLNEQRELARAILALSESREANRKRKIEILTVRLAELVVSLDQWIVGGGFLPTAWAKPL